MEMFLSRIYVSRPLHVRFVGIRRARNVNYPLVSFIVPEVVPENKQSGDFLMIVTDPPPDASE
jgi:hypothetical protein